MGYDYIGLEGKYFCRNCRKTSYDVYTQKRDAERKGKTVIYKCENCKSKDVEPDDTPEWDGFGA